MIEHCISALKKRREKKELVFYVTDVLKAIADNTAHSVNAGNSGTVILKRYAEVIDRKPPPPEDKRSCTEIATDIWNRAKIGRKKKRERT